MTSNTPDPWDSAEDILQAMHDQEGLATTLINLLDPLLAKEGRETEQVIFALIHSQRMCRNIAADAARAIQLGGVRP